MIYDHEFLVCYTIEAALQDCALFSYLVATFCNTVLVLENRGNAPVGLDWPHTLFEFRLDWRCLLNLLRDMEESVPIAVVQFSNITPDQSR